MRDDFIVFRYSWTAKTNYVGHGNEVILANRFSLFLLLNGYNRLFVVIVKMCQQSIIVSLSLLKNLMVTSITNRSETKADVKYFFLGGTMV